MTLIKNYKGKEWIITREYTYGKTGELLDVSHKVNKERKVILNSFKYKPDGALAEKRMHNGKIKTKYEYDELDRMVKVRPRDKRSDDWMAWWAKPPSAASL